MTKKWNRKQVCFLGLAMVSLLVFLGATRAFGWWQAGVAVLSAAIAATVFSVVFAFLGFEALNPTGRWFDTAEQLGSQHKRVLDYYSRIEGTLQFWKNQAAAHHRLHLARIFWSLASGISLPVLVQLFDKSDKWAILFMTMLTTWTGIVVAVAFTLRSEALRVSAYQR